MGTAQSGRHRYRPILLAEAWRHHRRSAGLPDANRPRAPANLAARAARAGLDYRHSFANGDLFRRDRAGKDRTGDYRADYRLLVTGSVVADHPAMVHATVE